MITLLCAYLAVFPAIAIWLTNRFFSKQCWPFTLPLFWLALEFSRAHFMTGFQWLDPNYW
jgi:apolipoprotein N-acyltransferase